jgi:hypothetical protein
LENEVAFGSVVVVVVESANDGFRGERDEGFGIGNASKIKKGHERKNMDGLETIIITVFCY